MQGGGICHAGWAPGVHETIQVEAARRGGGYIYAGGVYAMQDGPQGYTKLSSSMLTGDEGG